jgi:carbamoyltransferase
MIVLGISPLDKDATVSIVADGEVLFAAGEERFSRRKQHAGFPHRALKLAFESTGVRPEQVDSVAYAFLPWKRELAAIDESLAAESDFLREPKSANIRALVAQAKGRIPTREKPVHGLPRPNQTVVKPFLKRMAHLLAGSDLPTGHLMSGHLLRRYRQLSLQAHRRWQQELEDGLDTFGLRSKLKHYEHHLSHAANAYYASGFERALIVTLDGYGSGLCGAVSVGEKGKIRRLHDFPFPYSLGQFYENVTAALGFKPDRHAGKIVGLAAYGDPDVLSDVLLSRMEISNGEFRIDGNFNVFFSRYLSTQFPMVDVAAAYQHVLELVAAATVRHWIEKTGCDAVVLSGGVTANVKMNQRIYEVDGVERIFVYPNMGDGGCGTGLGLFLTNGDHQGTAMRSWMRV